MGQDCERKDPLAIPLTAGQRYYVEAFQKEGDEVETT